MLFFKSYFFSFSSHVQTIKFFSEIIFYSLFIFTLRVEIIGDFNFNGTDVVNPDLLAVDINKSRHEIKMIVVYCLGRLGQNNCNIDNDNVCWINTLHSG